MAELILALNAGSSTVKFALFALDQGKPSPRLRGLIDTLGAAPEDFAADIFDQVEQRLDGGRLSACAHRIAHGGPDFAAPVMLTDAVLSALDQLSPLAPLHQPHNLAMARAAMRLRPGLPAVAGFDTAFFHALPQTAQRVPIPATLATRTVRRYGFHGLSYSYLRRQLEAVDGSRSRRVITANWAGSTVSWARARACARASTARRSRRPWAFRRWTGW